MEKLSVIPFLLPALGSDVLGIPAGDGQRDNAGTEPFRGIRVLPHRQAPCPHCVSTWPLSSWPRGLLSSRNKAEAQQPSEGERDKSDFQPSQLPVPGRPISPNPGGSRPQVGYGERPSGSGTNAVLRSDRGECPLPKTAVSTVIPAACLGIAGYRTDICLEFVS